jgi:hypothetical protein
MDNVITQANPYTSMAPEITLIPNNSLLTRNDRPRAVLFLFIGTASL